MSPYARQSTPDNSREETRSVNKSRQLIKNKNPDRKAARIFTQKKQIMRTNFLIRAIIMFCLLMTSPGLKHVQAQVYLKSAWIGLSDYKDDHAADANEKGSAYVLRG